MKRLILMGGRPWVGEDEGKSFVDTLFRYFPKEVKLAFCIFAQPESDWEGTASRNEKMFNHLKGKREIQYKTMTKENFAEISKWADVIYMPGGNPTVLKESVTKYGDVGELWDGKVIAGSSAGADLMCENFVYLQDKTFGQGLSWIKTTCIPHWRSDFEDRLTDDDWDWIEKESLKRYPDTALLCIPESDFVEFTIR